MINPLMNMDYPDPDVIRVEDTYYMVSTTMHFMPGGVLLKSYDLMNWEIVSYIYDTLDDTPAQMLDGEKNIYGQGMWAPSLRYHKGMFYVLFAANDTHKTYLYRAADVCGPWEKSYIEGFYHDSSLFFDDDDRVYIIYGNKSIRITELDSGLNGPKAGGLDRIIVEDTGHPGLGFEGTHFYKINGRYYSFFIHSLRDRWFRTEACYTSDSLEGEFTGGDVLQDDMGHRGAGVAQGGIVDTPDGEWYAVLFQDRGAVGRIPVLVPVRWENDYPIFGVDGRVPREINVKSTRPDYKYSPLYESDKFDYISGKDGRYEIKKVWQWNHAPKRELYSFEERKGVFRVYSGKICSNLTQAYNILTQRTYDSYSEVSVIVDAEGINEGDYAGICAFQGLYAAIAVTKDSQGYELVMLGKDIEDCAGGINPRNVEERVYDRHRIDSPAVRLKCSFDCRCGKDEARFFYESSEGWKELGHGKKMQFTLDHFTGCRYGLFYYSTIVEKGHADFMDFVYEVSESSRSLE